MILEHDPDWAARYRAAVRERGVTAYLDHNGSMTITGQGLAPDEAAAAMARIDDLAAAIRRAGHPNLLPHIRADVYLALLDGTLNHLNRAKIVTEMLRRARPEDTEPTPPSVPDDPSNDNQDGEDAVPRCDAAGAEPRPLATPALPPMRPPRPVQPPRTLSPRPPRVARTPEVSRWPGWRSGSGWRHRRATHHRRPARRPHRRPGAPRPG